MKKKTIDKILSERNLGPFVSMDDFFKRVDPSFSDAKALVKARCFGSLRGKGERKLTNAKLMWLVYERQAKKSGALAPEKSLPALQTKIPEYPREKMILWEQQYLDGFVTFPSWFLYRDLLKNQAILPSGAISRNTGKEVILYGQKVSLKPVRAKYDRRMAFITFADDGGMYNTTLFPDQYDEFSDLLMLGGSFLIKGKIEKDLDDCQVIISDIQRIGEI